MNNFLTMLSLVGLVLSTPASAFAGVGLPYKKLEIDCRSETESLKLMWDFSKSFYLHEVLVNGQNEIAYMDMRINKNNITTYSKEGIFSISFSREDDQKQIKKVVIMQDRPVTMVCTQRSSWHIFRSGDN